MKLRIDWVMEFLELYLDAGLVKRLQVEVLSATDPGDIGLRPKSDAQVQNPLRTCALELKRGAQSGLLREPKCLEHGVNQWEVQAHQFCASLAEVFLQGGEKRFLVSGPSVGLPQGHLHLSYPVPIGSVEDPDTTNRRSPTRMLHWNRDPTDACLRPNSVPVLKIILAEWNIA